MSILSPKIPLLLISLLLPFTMEAENLRFPADAVANVVTDYGAKGDGITDDTAAIQAALDANEKLIYFPNGTYLISQTLSWFKGSGKNEVCKRQIFQGQSEAGVKIKLKDKAIGFQDAANPAALIWTGKAPAQRFRNSLRNLTIDTGNDNPGAIGIQFVANNQGGIFNVTFQHGNMPGPIGLDLGYTDEQGPCLIKNVTVKGFGIGIHCKHAVDSVTFENIHLEGQQKYGLFNNDQCLSIRNLTSKNSVPAIYNERWGLIALVDSKLEGTGNASTQSAMVNDANMFIRNVDTPGYQYALSGKKTPTPLPAPRIDEYATKTFQLFPGRKTSLNLPIQETPDVEWDDPKDWASVTAFGPPRKITLIHRESGQKQETEDWSEALQRAIDSGATTVYFPKGSYGLYGPVVLRGNLRRLIGCESNSMLTAKDTDRATDFQDEYRFIMTLESGTAPVVVVERFDSWYSSPGFIQNSKRTLVIKNLSFYEVITKPGSGDVFLEDTRAKSVEVNLSRLWSRQINPEGHEDPRILNNGGQLWILGLKTEGSADVAKVTHGGKLEIIGGFIYGNRTAKSPNALLTIEDGELSATLGEWKTKNGEGFSFLASETQDGVTKELPANEGVNRGEAKQIPLYLSQ